MIFQHLLVGIALVQSQIAGLDSTAAQYGYSLAPTNTSGKLSGYSIIQRYSHDNGSTILVMVQKITDEAMHKKVIDEARLSRTQSLGAPHETLGLSKDVATFGVKSSRGWNFSVVSKRSLVQIRLIRHLTVKADDLPSNLATAEKSVLKGMVQRILAAESKASP